MSTHDRIATSIALAFGSAVAWVACGGGSSTTSPPDAAPPDARPPAPDAAPPDASPPDAPPPPTLTLSLDPALDTDPDTVKATAITAADLLDTSGTAVAHATVANDQAVFAIGALAPGEFFIKVNGDADDLVPTRIDNPAASVVQRVGQKLRASLIGPENSPVYRVNTYSAGQGESPIVRFSDGTTIAGEQPYIFITLALPKVDIKVLGTGARVSTLLPGSQLHPSTLVPFDAWILNTSGQPHHGDAYNAAPSSCSGCHTKLDMKPASYADITVANGWCFHCHNGTAGDGSGFVDPTQ